MRGPIVVPLDGSELAEQALRIGAAITRRTGRALHLVSVHETAAVLPGDGFDASWDPRWFATTKAGREQYVEEVAERFRLDALEVSAAVPEGPVTPTLLRHIERLEPWLVVMTTHGRGGLSRLWLGSTVDRLMQGLPVPLLVVRSREEPESDIEPRFDRVLIPLDGSELAEQVIEPARGLGAHFESSYLLLRVVPIPYTIGSPHMPHSVQVDPEELRQRMEEARSYLDGVRAGIDSSDCSPVHTRAIEGHGQSIATHVLKEAEVAKADLIALATHGRGGLGRAIMGSIADKIVRASPVPVLVVRPRQQA